MKGTKYFTVLLVSLGLCSWLLASRTATAGDCGHAEAADCAPCEAECGECGECGHCCDDDPCEVAELLCILQSACRADDRREAADDLGEFDCCCHPEITAALIAALSDCDADVRKEAADELGDMGCCTEEVIAALEKALGDCDDDVRDEARDSLEKCGVCVIECEPCGECGGCDVCGTCGGCGAPVEAAPAPAPEDQSAGIYGSGSPVYSARRVHETPASMQPVREKKGGLRSLFNFGRSR